ncbi:MAG: S8 family serine peptidase, partial [Micromonosporaceae bacterium]
MTAAMAVSGALIGAAAPAHADQWRDRQWHLDFLKAEQVHEITKGEGVTVAVVDSGVDGNHPDLKGNVLKGMDFSGGGGNGWRDRDGHGTAMASLIAGNGHGSGNRDGTMGLAPEAKILPFRVGGGDPDNEDPLFDALDRAAYSEAKVINFSAQGGGTITAVETALAQGVVFVAAAGNTAQDIDEVQQPASYPGVIAVSGVDRDGNFTSESVKGPEVV